MGYYGRLEDRIKAQGLRKRGLSYGEILHHINVSKGTLSEWLKDIRLTKAQQKRLFEAKILGQYKGSQVAADNKRKARIARTKVIFQDAKKSLGRLSKRDRFIAGIALYAAEGQKADGNGGFANSDPKIIKFMMKWFREFGKLPIEKFRGALWIHENLDEIKAKQFWSKLTGIPIEQFHKTYIAENKTQSRKIRKNIHEYGVFSIRFSHSDTQRQVIGWISAFFNGKIKAVP